MTTMRESTLVRNMLQTLNSYPDCKAIKVHGSEFTESGTPDIIGCWRGRMFVIEVKATKTGKPTAIQQTRLAQWRAAGAVARVMQPPLDFASLWADLLRAEKVGEAR